MKRRMLFAALLALSAAPAWADEAAPPLTIPPLTVDPNPTPSIWNGLYVGGGVTAAFAKGHKGGFGGDVFAGYDRTFDNHLVLGVKFDTGYAPGLGGFGRYRGFDYATGIAKVGYDFGRITPYVYAGGGIARATAFSSEFPDAATTLNGAFGQGPGAAVGAFGAGVDYHVTNNVTLSVEAGMLRGPQN